MSLLGFNCAGLKRRSIAQKSTTCFWHFCAETGFVQLIRRQRTRPPVSVTNLQVWRHLIFINGLLSRWRETQVDCAKIHDLLLAFRCGSADCLIDSPSTLSAASSRHKSACLPTLDFLKCAFIALARSANRLHQNPRPAFGISVRKR